MFDGHSLNISFFMTRLEMKKIIQVFWKHRDLKQYNVFFVRYLYTIVVHYTTCVNFSKTKLLDLSMNLQLRSHSLTVHVH